MKLRPENDSILQKYAREAKARGWCEQCQYPWHDGLCECGHWEDPEVETASQRAFELILNEKDEIRAQIRLRREGNPKTWVEAWDVATTDTKGVVTVIREMLAARNKEREEDVRFVEYLGGVRI